MTRHILAAAFMLLTSAAMVQAQSLSAIDLSRYFTFDTAIVDEPAADVTLRPTDTWTQVFAVTWLAANGADLGSTIYALAKHAGKEGNPIARLYVHNPLAAGVIKMGIAGLLGWGFIELSRDHPMLARVCALVGTMVYLVIATHNMNVINGR